MTLWYAGQKIVCISDSWKATHGESVPQKGSIYTIEHIETKTHTGDLGFQLLELINTPRWYDQGFSECNFQESGFRPLLKRKAKTDISELKKLLAPKKKERKHEPAT